ncbi:MAG: hypothetical protein K9J42_00385 [Sulfuritalea sp.]|nr:hypothetical protein [Sulfuritalea sp.]
MRPFSHFYLRLRPSNYPRLVSLFGLPASGRQIETAILEMTTRLQSNPVQVIDHWLQWRAENPVSRRNGLRQALAGTADALVDAGCSRRLAWQWDIPLAVHPSVEHDLPLDDGAGVVEQVRRWFDRDTRDC